MKRFALLATLILAIFLIPESSAFAQTVQLVVCEGDTCNACNLVKLANNVIKFLIVLSILLAAILFMYAGFLFVTSGGNESQLKKGKEMFKNVFIGIIIVLTGFLIVDTVMKTLAGDSLMGGGPWNQIQCVPNPSAISTGVWNPGDSGSVSVTPTGSTATDCPNCTRLEGIPCKNANSCTVDPSYAANLNQLSSWGLVITEAYPPTITHQAACHSNGTCTDIVFANNDYSPERIRQFQAAADTAGYRAVYEPVGSCPAGMTQAQCLPSSVTRATGTHFSLYKK